MDSGALGSVTRGLVGDTSFAVLPEVTKESTFALTIFFQIVSTLANERMPLQDTDKGLALFGETLVPARLGHICRSNYTLWLRFVPVRMACPRESDPPRPNPIQLNRSQRPSIPRGFYTLSCCRSRLPISAHIHRRRIPLENRIHHILASDVLIHAQKARARPTETTGLPLGPVFFALQYGVDSIDCVLCACPPYGVWGEI